MPAQRAQKRSRGRRAPCPEPPGNVAGRGAVAPFVSAYRCHRVEHREQVLGHGRARGRSRSHGPPLSHRLGRQARIVEKQRRHLGTFASVGAGIVRGVHPSLIEFPADDPQRARRFWSSLLDAPLEERADEEGSGWQTHRTGPHVGVHERGRGPGDTASLPYFAVDDLDRALERVKELGGSIIHPGSRWAICRDSEGSPFGLASTHRAER